MSTLAPVTPEQITPEWIAERREIVGRDGFALRAGDRRATIEVKSLVTNEWCVLTLPGGAQEFASPYTRDAVLLELQGVRAMAFRRQEAAV